MYHPNEFQVNEAWIAFVLNEFPIRTEQNGAFNCICLMDAASCFILATEMITTTATEPSEIEARRLFKVAQAHNPSKPKKLFVPTGQFKKYIAAEANRRGMEVISVNEQDLLVFVGEARQGFTTHVQGSPASET